MRLVLACAAALVFGTAASAVTVINGSFENDLSAAVLYAAPDTSVALLQPLPLSLAGWTVFRGGVAYIGNQWAGAGGSQSLLLSSGAAGGIAQRIGGFVVGQRYRLSFDVSADPANPRGTTRLYYAASGGDTAMFDYAANGSTAKGVPYSHVTYDFVASAKSQQIGFFGIDDQFGPVLDNVAISAIPEPATWGLMIAGFIGTGALVRRRNRIRSTLA